MQTINLTDELVSVIKAISEIGLEIRLYSSYGQSYPKHLTELDGNDLMHLTDSFERLGGVLNGLQTMETVEDIASVKKSIELEIKTLLSYIKHDAARNWEQPYFTFKEPHYYKIMEGRRPGVELIRVLKFKMPGLHKFNIESEERVTNYFSEENPEGNRFHLVEGLVRALHAINSKLDTATANT